MAQIDDINAIDKYLTNAKAKTDTARTTQMNFLKYMKTLSWLEKTTDANVLAKARRYRDDFNNQNAAKGTSTSTSKPLPAQMPTIRQGSKGEAVKTLQQKLGIPADGAFGPQTHATLVAYQRKNGLVADGIAGPATWNKLLEGNVYAVASQQMAAPKSPPRIDVTKLAPKPPITTDKSPIVQKGSMGQSVVEVQKLVGAKPDGVFGPETEEKVKSWQIKQGLAPTGVFSPDMAAASMVSTIPSPAKVVETTQIIVEKTPLWAKVAIGAGLLIGAVKMFMG